MEIHKKQKLKVIKLHRLAERNTNTILVIRGKKVTIYHKQIPEKERTFKYLSKILPS